MIDRAAFPAPSLPASAKLSSLDCSRQEAVVKAVMITKSSTQKGVLRIGLSLSKVGWLHVAVPLASWCEIRCISDLIFRELWEVVGGHNLMSSWRRINGESAPFYMGVSPIERRLSN